MVVPAGASEQLIRREAKFDPRILDKQSTPRTSKFFSGPLETPVELKYSRRDSRGPFEKLFEISVGNRESRSNHNSLGVGRIT
jgi:hypothetical protein